MSEIKSKEELAKEIRWLRARQAHDLRMIDELKEQVKGYEELIGVNNGLVAAVLNVAGEITIPREAVIKAAQELEVAVAVDMQNDTYTMKAVPLVRKTVRVKSDEEGTE